VIAVDSSVVVAVLLGEPDREIWIDILDRTPRSLMSVVSYLEANMVMASRWFDADVPRVDATLRALRISVVPVSLDQGRIALNAFVRFGKGRHAAALNLGDCFSYALAKARNLPLLFKGDDFAATDIVPAWRA
jgi:ribonuclease VapC